MKRVIATIVITLGMVFVGASAAYAHNAYVYHGNDWGVVGSDHLQGKVSDQECDGHDVYMYLWLQNGNLVKRWDKDGCKNGVKSWSVNSKVNWSFVCEARPPAGLDGDVCSNNVTHWNG